VPRPIRAFLDEVVEFLNDEVLEETYNEERYFDECVVRVDYDREVVKVTRLCFCRKNSNGEMERVNDILTGSELWFEFHFIGDGDLDGEWGEVLNQIVIRLDVPDVDIPPVLKWEGRDGVDGDLKFEEWLGPEEEYVERNISANDCIRRSIDEQLHRIIPDFEDRSAVEELAPRTLKLWYNSEHERAILEQLDIGH